MYVSSVWVIAAVLAVVRKFQRIDSLRRHLTDVHFNRPVKGTGVHCTLNACKRGGCLNCDTILLIYLRLKAQPRVII